MNLFKEAEVKDLLNKVTKEEITFSRFVEILNERLLASIPWQSTPGGSYNPLINPFEKTASESDMFQEHMKRIEHNRKKM